MRTRKKLNDKYDDFHFRKADAPSSRLNYVVEYGDYHTVCSGIPTLEDAERIAKRTKSAVEKGDKSSMYFPDTHSPIWGKQRNIAETRG